ncbi:MAG: metallophosphoesterase [Methanosarcinaceae archaeon]|nr:metallophosphoesterase [Methanosarcinaceae archaeon]MDD4331205.1 metallophosphoesterase [Methanosarcinaceae archaeon]MDD4749580.1 metallophosphoesterase [Methanosarcinaceae archaeon]
MKLLAIADLHGDYSKVEALLKKAGNFDLVLLAGDLTDFGPDEKAEELFKILDKFGKPVFAIPGNCDLKSLPKTLEKTKVTNLHARAKTFGNIHFLGLGGSNPTPFDTPFELSEEEIEKSLEELISSAESSKNCERLVLLTHAPPLGACDEIPSGHVGSAAIGKVAPRVDLIICGHIHEAKGVEKIGNAIIVNPGEACKGSCALITLAESDKEKPIDVKLIEV